MKDLPDLYRILQVDPGADPDVIDAVYRRLARKYHPDVNPSADANRQMQDINMAYETLGDPDRRAEYDRRNHLWSEKQRRPAAPTYRESYVPIRPRRTRRYTDETPPRPSLVAMPEVLDFGSLPRGSRRTVSLRVGVTQGRTIRGRVVSNQPWISINTPNALSNLGEATVEVTVDTSGLRDGVTHFGSVSIESLAYGGLAVPVTLFVPEEPKPRLRVEPEVLRFDALPNNDHVQVHRIRIWDESECPMSGSVHVKPGWLKANVVDFENEKEVTVDLTADVRGLRPGHCYSGRIEVHSSTGRATVVVKVTVMPEPTPVFDFDHDTRWAEQLANIQATTEWERAFLQTVLIQARQRGWKPSISLRTMIESLWRRHLEKDC
jgi:hypothetical protein